MSKSIAEEIVAGIYLCAGLLAWLADFRWLAWILFLKAAMDTFCAIVAVRREIKKEGK